MTLTVSNCAEYKNKFFKLISLAPNDNHEPNKKLIGKTFRLLNRACMVTLLDNSKVHVLSYGCEVELLQSVR